MDLVSIVPEIVSLVSFRTCSCVRFFSQDRPPQVKRNLSGVTRPGSTPPRGALGKLGERWADIVKVVSWISQALFFCFASSAQLVLGLAPRTNAWGMAVVPWRGLGGRARAAPARFGPEACRPHVSNKHRALQASTIHMPEDTRKQ